MENPINENGLPRKCQVSYGYRKRKQYLSPEAIHTFPDCITDVNFKQYAMQNIVSLPLDDRSWLMPVPYIDIWFD